jgi:hypothetical protein
LKSREKERKRDERTRDKEKERQREREKASRCTKGISAAKTGREAARAAHQQPAGMKRVLAQVPSQRPTSRSQKKMPGRVFYAP